MNWSDASAPSVPEATSQIDEQSSACQPFSQQRRMRLLVLSLVIGGGLLMIVGMQLITGGPASAVAASDAESTISAYLAPDDSIAHVAKDDPLAVLSRFGTPQMSVPLSNLRHNPFLLPGSAAGGPTPLPRITVDQARTAREAELRSRVAHMRVSMVLQGRHSVAVVGDLSLPFGTPVELDQRTHLRLVSIDRRGITVEASDPSIDVSTLIQLDRP